MSFPAVTYHFTGTGTTWGERHRDLHRMWERADSIISTLATRPVNIDAGLVLRVESWTDVRTPKAGVRVTTNSAALLAALTLGWAWWPARDNEPDPAELWRPHVFRDALAQADLDAAARFWRRADLGKLPAPRVLDVHHELEHNASWRRFATIAS